MLTVLAGVMAATWLCLRKRSQARLRREVLSEVSWNDYCRSVRGSI